MQRPPPTEPEPSEGTKNPKPDADRAAEDATLDEELEETFPASDPRPWTHRDE
jgi:hypothetical protein